MARIDLGRVVGPRGNKWFIGTTVAAGGSVPGTTVETSSFVSDGEDSLIAGDLYLNTSTREYFECVTATTALSVWRYIGVLKGDKGEPLSFDDLTSAQKEELRGERGPQGEPFSVTSTVFDSSSLPASANVGDAYLTTADGCLHIYMESAVGGSEGWSDPIPFRGHDGATISTVSEAESHEDGGVNTVTIGLDNGSSYSFSVRNGTRGAQGVQGYSVARIESAVESSVNIITLYNNNGAGEAIGSFAVRDGAQGVQGVQGIQGVQGTLWHLGNAVDGTGSSVQMQQGVQGEENHDARFGDFYLNEGNGNYYRCIVAGGNESSVWEYIGTLKGVKGETGDTQVVVAEHAATGLDADRDSAVTSETAPGFVYVSTDSQCLYTFEGYDEHDNVFRWSEPQSLKGVKGDRGNDGHTFTPHINELTGTLTWTNDGHFVNPEPFQMRNAGTNVVCSPVQPSNPYRGMVWIQEQDATSTVRMDVNRLEVVRSETEPANPKNGTIWVKTSN